MSRRQHDLVVIGGGPGGYVAAIRAAQLGMDVACIDEHSQLGGTCLRVGCIPSKALLESSHLYAQAQDSLASHGISLGNVDLDLAAMLARKDKIVQQLTGGIAMLFKRNGVTAYHGRGTVLEAGRVAVDTEEGTLEVAARRILVATGSRPAGLRGVQIDGDLVGDSTTALGYAEVPSRLVVIGGGYIGVELGSVWSRLGSQVIVLEYLDRILPGLDQEIGQLAHRALAKQGLDIRTGMKVERVETQDGACIVHCAGAEPIECDRVLVSTGRVPCSDGLGLEQVGVQRDQRGFIQVDGDYGTTVPGIYAVGDVIGGAMLAHKASEEGIVCVERMGGIKSRVNYDAIPAVVYTHPEIASVGFTEEQLVQRGTPFAKGICPYGASGRALAIGEPIGRVKILAHAETDRILGVHIIGAHAGDLIAEAVAAIEFGATSEDLARCCHPHPTLSELLHEAALAVSKRAIHTA